MAVDRKLKDAAKEAVIISAQKGQKEARESFRIADEIRSQSQTLLKPDDILSGQADAAKLYRYMTRLPNGTYRPITLQDVIEFDKRRAAMKDRWRKGVTAKDIIDLATAVPLGQKKSDLQKAREQIHAAVPITTKAGELKFSTNTGPNSDRQRHYVSIKMLNFEAAVAAAAPPEQIVKQVVQGPLAIGCSCGQWRFVFAYMATSGGYGLPEHRETAFPKIRNPSLSGIACKHIVKVASVLLQSPTIRGYVSRLIADERNRTQTKLRREAQKTMKEIQDKMSKESSRQKAIRTSAEKRAARQAQPAEQARMAAREAAKAKVEAKASRKAQATKPVSDSTFLKNMMAMGFSEAQARAALAAAKATK